MRIQKYNEEFKDLNTEIEKKLWYCSVKFSDDSIISGVFTNEEGLENWFLNMANEEIINNVSIKKAQKIQGVKINGHGEPIFIEFSDAVNWYQDKFDCEVYYEEVDFYENVKLENDVDLFKNTTKFNI